MHSLARTIAVLFLFAAGCGPALAGDACRVGDGLGDTYKKFAYQCYGGCTVKDCSGLSIQHAAECARNANEVFLMCLTNCSNRAKTLIGCEPNEALLKLN
jgi:hypothetical protein